MTEELSDKEREELENLDIAIKSEEAEEAEQEGAEGEGGEGNGEEVLDAHGGDITSSTTPTAEEMESDDVLTAPLTGTVLNTETGAPIVEENEDGPN